MLPEEEGTFGFVKIVVSGGDVDEHEGLAVAPEGVPHEFCDFASPVFESLLGCVFLLPAEGGDHLGQLGQTLVDIVAFPCLLFLAIWVAFNLLFTPS